MECFYEQFQTKKYGRIQWTLNVTSKILMILGGISLLFFKFVMVATFLFLYTLILLFSRNVFVEYEYELTNNELDIVKIMNKKNRKIISTINILQIEEIKSVSDIKTDDKIITAGLKNTKLKERVIFVKTALGLVGFRVALDEDLTRLIKLMNPSIFKSEQ